jgi:hypothetical protein
MKGGSGGPEVYRKHLTDTISKGYRKTDYSTIDDLNDFIVVMNKAQKPQKDRTKST